MVRGPPNPQSSWPCGIIRHQGITQNREKEREKERGKMKRVEGVRERGRKRERRGESDGGG